MQFKEHAQHVDVAETTCEFIAPISGIPLPRLHLVQVYRVQCVACQVMVYICSVALVGNPRVSRCASRAQGAFRTHACQSGTPIIKSMHINAAAVDLHDKGWNNETSTTDDWQ